MLHKTN